MQKNDLNLNHLPFGLITLKAVHSDNQISDFTITNLNAVAKRITKLTENQTIKENLESINRVDIFDALVICAHTNKSAAFILDKKSMHTDQDLQVNIKKDGTLTVLSLLPIVAKKESKLLKNKLLAEQLQLAVQSAQIGIWDWNMLNNKVSFSHEWKSMLGFNDQEVKNEFSEWERLVHPEDAKIAQKRIQECIQDPSKHYEIVFRMKNKFEQYVYVKSTGKIVERQEDGTPVRFVGTHINIDKQIRTNQELSLFGEALKHSTNGIIITDQDGLCIWVNEGFTKLTGYTIDDILGEKPGSILQGEETSEQTKQKIAKHLAKKEPVSVEIVNYTKNGNKKWIQLDIYPIFDDNGNISNYVGLESDITERKDVLHTLQENKKRLELAVTSAHQGFWDWDLATNEVYFSNEYKEILGYHEHEIEASYEAAVSLINEKYQQSTLNHIQESITKRSKIDIEVQMNTKQGSPKWIHLRGQAMYDQQDRPVRVLGIITDIQQRKQIQEQIERQKTILNTIINSVPQGMYLQDCDTNNILMTNAALEKFIRYETDTNNILDWIYNDKEIDKLSAENKSLVTQNKVSTKEEEWKTKINNLVVKTTKIPIIKVNDNNSLILTILEDITEKTRLLDNFKHERNIAIDRLNDLEQFRRLTIGRELRMLELKEENNKLKEQSTLEHPHHSDQK